MLIDIISVKALPNNTLYLKFEDGLEGEVKVGDIIKFTGVFEPLKDEAFFNQVSLNEETGTIFWPNEADICSDVLYSKLSGKSIEEELESNAAS